MAEALGECADVLTAVREKHDRVASVLRRLLEYRVAKDPDGMTTYPQGALGGIWPSVRSGKSWAGRSWR
ncbi:hypothetical protein JOF53_003062 [Crossiella equi]|uniref:Uncharacterized protein n=1 Tax=Crossiella equi TaxID=130796 RepID=A0ABS5AER8_9PSEU|nr:hypothetical protein [Crossiella equi]MBP2474190.1 hypothetical protein [Crossiella equi]